mmetsp:Transcript_125646/g.314002  ORF Transcript_125646/g.314002 Transcript_125646/m.314002 type:complete len:201 (+) Transcript_125646:263-865(+)
MRLPRFSHMLVRYLGIANSQIRREGCLDWGELGRDALLLASPFNSCKANLSSSISTQLSIKAISDNVNCFGLLSSLPGLIPRQLNSNRTSPSHFNLRHACFRSESVKKPAPSLSKDLNASSTDPKWASAHFLNDPSNSAPAGSHSRRVMVPDTSRSRQRHAAPTLPLNLSFLHACWNSDQLTWLSLSWSRRARQAVRECG